MKLWNILKFHDQIMHLCMIWSWFEWQTCQNLLKFGLEVRFLAHSVPFSTKKRSILHVKWTVFLVEKIEMERGRSVKNRNIHMHIIKEKLNIIYYFVLTRYNWSRAFTVIFFKNSEKISMGCPINMGCPIIRIFGSFCYPAPLIRDAH